MRDDLNRADLMSNRTIHEGPRRDPDDAIVTGTGGDTPDTRSLDERLASGLKVWADVGLRLGQSLDAQADRHQKAIDRLQRMTPVDYQVSVYGVYASPGPLILNLGSPDLGTVWEVESVIVGGSEVTTSVAGTAGLYVTAVPTVQGLGLSNAVDVAASGTLPNAGFYGRKDIVVTAQENLVVAIWNGTVGTGYIASTAVTVINVAAAQGFDVNSI